MNAAPRPHHLPADLHDWLHSQTRPLADVEALMPSACIPSSTPPRHSYHVTAVHHGTGRILMADFIEAEHILAALGRACIHLEKNYGVADHQIKSGIVRVTGITEQPAR